MLKNGPFTHILLNTLITVFGFLIPYNILETPNYRMKKISATGTHVQKVWQSAILNLGCKPEIHL